MLLRCVLPPLSCHHLVPVLIIYRCTVHGCRLCLARSVVELYALYGPHAIRARLFLRRDRLRRCIPPRGLLPILASLLLSSPHAIVIIVISSSARTPPRHCLPVNARRSSMCARSSWRSCGRPLQMKRMHRTRMLFSSRARCKKLFPSLQCPLLQPGRWHSEPVLFLFHSTIDLLDSPPSPLSCLVTKIL
jgi:hypothetical protein